MSSPAFSFLVIYEISAQIKGFLRLRSFEESTTSLTPIPEQVNCGD